METKTHYKKLQNPDYIGAYALEPGKDLTVTIESVQLEQITGAEGKKEMATVAKLKGQKPFIINSTNAKMITKLANSPYIEDWKGVSITLYAAKVKAFGDIVEALRIRPTPPKKEQLTPTHPAWAKAVDGIKKGSVTIEQVKAKYELTKENETELCK